MFNITQYLQYKNTLDGKPRVLTEGKDYLFKSPINLINFSCESESAGDPVYKEDGIDFPRKMIYKEYEVADLEDCRPLLTINIDGIEWTEGEIMTEDEEYFPISDDERKYFTYFVCNGRHGGLGLNLYHGVSQYSEAELEFYSGLGADGTIIEDSKKLGSFFDNPAKYSKLLWDCSEEEGWQKVFDLLEIKP